MRLVARRRPAGRAPSHHARDAIEAHAAVPSISKPSGASAVSHAAAAGAAGPAAGSVLRLAVHQFAPRLGDPVSNFERIAAGAADAAADVFVTPELAATGYDVREDATHLATPLQIGAPLQAAGHSALADAGTGVLVVGLIERGRHGLPYNAAAIVGGGTVGAVYRKIHLPSYGMFDEARYFGRGERLLIFEPAPGWRVGVLICEDFWHPGLLYVLAAAGIDVLLVQAAAPGRGVWLGGEGGGRFQSADIWERIARTAAEQYGIYVALSNRTGVEGGVTFAGGSLVAAPDGTVIAHAADHGEAVLAVTLAADELAAARRPFAHARDDDPRLVVRELERLVLS
jgi:predicted amidohydrolase